MKNLAFFLCLMVSLPAMAQTFEWANGMGGGTSESTLGVSVDDSGNVYATGWFNGTADFDASAGTYNLTSSGGQDIFVVKTDASGNLLWAKNFGGTSTLGDFGYKVRPDNAGSVYATGTFFGTADFDPGAGTTLLTSVGSNDAYLMKLDASTGNLVWVNQFGGTGMEEGNALEVDNSGNVLLAGGFTTSMDFDPGPGTYTLSGTAMEAYIVKIDPSANLVWAKSFGGNHQDGIVHLSLDNSGNIYVSGSTLSDGPLDFDPGAGVFNLYPSGQQDAFVLKLDASGNFVWAGTMGSPVGGETANAITTDTSGNMYITGEFQDVVDFDPGAGTYNLTSLGEHDGFVLKLNSSGSFVWAYSFGSVFQDRGTDIKLDIAGDVYVTGPYGGTTDFDPSASSWNMTPVGARDVFIFKTDNASNFIWSASAGDIGDETAWSLYVDDDYNVYAGGYHNFSGDFDPGAGTFNINSFGGQECYVWKLSQCGATIYRMGSSLVASPAGATSYQWVDCDNGMAPIPGETGKTFTPTIDGNYAVVVTNAICTSTSPCEVFTLTGIDQGLSSSVQVFPNPSSGSFEVALAGVTKGVMVLTDLSGKQIERKMFEATDRVRFNLDLPSGVYLLRMESGESVVTQKIMIGK